jgi:hypothetical protein
MARMTGPAIGRAREFSEETMLQKTLDWFVRVS